MEDKRKIKVVLFLTLLLSIILCILNAIALKFHLYFTTFWADNLNHFLGGSILSLVFFSISLFLGRQGIYFGKNRFFLIIFLCIVVGLLWEFFEFYFGLTFVEASGYWRDTTLDVIMDTIGSVLMLKYIIKKIEK